MGPLLALAIYIVIMDFGEYWRHRFRHTFGRWWALHSVHYAQTRMTSGPMTGTMGRTMSSPPPGSA